MVQNAVDHIPGAVNHVDDAFRKSDFIHNFKNLGLGHGHLLRRFEDIGIAGDQGVGQKPPGDHGRKVIGRDPGKNAQGLRVSVAVDIGGDVFQESLRCTNTDGRLVVIGFAAGTIQQIAANYLLLKNISVAGYAFSIYSRAKPEHYRGLFADLTRMYESGAFKPHISAVVPREQAADGLRMLETRRATGKVVIATR